MFKQGTLRYRFGAFCMHVEGPKPVWHANVHFTGQPCYELLLWHVRVCMAGASKHAAHAKVKKRLKGNWITWCGL